MDQDLFIITVYCLVVEHYPPLVEQYGGRRGGCPPTLTDEEVLTMEICGEYLKLASDKDLYEYFAKPYRHFFPHLTERTSFVRQAANLWQFTAALQHRLVQVSGQAHDPVQAIDTMPLPVCTYTRARRDKRFTDLADDGHCAAKKLDYYGFKLGVRLSRAGMIICAPLLAARPHDVNHLGTLIEGCRGLVPADKGFIDAYQQHLWQARQHVQVVTPVRSNMAAPAQPALVKWTQRWRKLVETVNSQLTERFNITRIRVRDFWHYQHRILRKVLAHTVLVFLNLRLRRPPLDFEGLVTV